MGNNKPNVRLSERVLQEIVNLANRNYRDCSLRLDDYTRHNDITLLSYSWTMAVLDVLESEGYEIKIQDKKE